jgi:hypothetical protein
MNKEFFNGKTNIDSEYIEHIIENFNIAFDNNEDFVYLGFEFIDEEIKSYNIHRDDWQSTMDMFFHTAINLELYELCPDLEIIKEKISKLK